MDFALRCNTLKCRAQLTVDAVVTTCSHIFCVACAESSGLASAPSSARVCPACRAALPAPDDAVRAALDPPDDYKTSVLGGLSPSVLMECAGRGLAFYTYQAAQEIVYQEFVARGLREKNHGLNDEMDRLVQQANLEIGSLRDRTAALQADKTELEAKNHELANAFREKCRKVKELDKLYTTMKQKQDAAMVMKQVEKEARHDGARFGPGVEPRHDFSIDRVRSRSRSSADSAERAARLHHHHHQWQNQPESSRPGMQTSRSAPVSLLPATPFGHRTRLGGYPAPPGLAQIPGSIARHGAHPRQPLRSIDPNAYADGNANGSHGMSAGMKIGRPHAGVISRKSPVRSPTGFPL